jgi:hypothetical protein
MHYIPVARPPPQTTAIFRDFKKSTAMCKVHNVGLRYIKNIWHSKMKDFGTRAFVAIAPAIYLLSSASVQKYTIYKVHSVKKGEI